MLLIDTWMAARKATYCRNSIYQHELENGSLILFCRDCCSLKAPKTLLDTILVDVIGHSNCVNAHNDIDYAL